MALMSHRKKKYFLTQELCILGFIDLEAQTLNHTQLDWQSYVMLCLLKEILISRLSLP